MEQPEVLELLKRWGQAQPALRAMLLTSSRAIPGAAVDLLSDYDVILVLRDVRPFYEDSSWLQAFGTLLGLYRDPLQTVDGALKAGYVVQYEDDLKIDFTLWQVETLQQIAAAPRLPAELDAGYLVLLDKDGLAALLRPPGGKGYIPAPPSQERYRAIIKGFFLDSIYVGKYLWRDDLVAAKFMLTISLIDEHLRPVLEWHYEIEHNWSLKPGPYGRRMKRWLRPDLWAALERTYVGHGLEENWGALFELAALMRKVAREVGQSLGYAYPEDTDRRTTAYLERIKALPR